MGISFERPSAFASEKWCTVPFLGREKRPLDWLGDILLQFPNAFILRNSMREIRDQSHLICEPTRKAVHSKAIEIIALLEDYWDKYGTVVDSAYDCSHFIETSDFRGEPTSWVIETPLAVRFSSPATATNIAMYDAAVVLANALAWESNSGYPEVNKRKIVLHCASILAAIIYHEGKGPESGGSINMVLPMKVVCRATPSNDQRRQAQLALDRWGKLRGLEGICGFAVPERHGIYGNIRKMEAASEIVDSSAPIFASHNLPIQLLDAGYSELLGYSGGSGRVISE